MSLVEIYAQGSKAIMEANDYNTIFFWIIASPHCHQVNDLGRNQDLFGRIPG
ncbi:hypothetical protein [Legionella parisiensis]|uniref:hypothetical protein n=1 Tax=Legionella parisiensis TaxID=45071 RepID=UPI0012E39643|nr:hypothetical protein [Legionella parisiensis]